MRHRPIYRTICAIGLALGLSACGSNDNPPNKSVYDPVSGNVVYYPELNISALEYISRLQELFDKRFERTDCDPAYAKSGVSQVCYRLEVCFETKFGAEGERYGDTFLGMIIGLDSIGGENRYGDEWRGSKAGPFALIMLSYLHGIGPELERAVVRGDTDQITKLRFKVPKGVTIDPVLVPTENWAAYKYDGHKAVGFRFSSDVHELIVNYKGMQHCTGG